MSSALPLDRIFESQGWVAFRHPHPSYPFHVLLVPKRAIPQLHFHLVSDSQAAGKAFSKKPR